jgi:hypothetical protein
MWQTHTQADSWINIGGGEIPDHWIRLSLIARIEGVKGAGNAMVTTIGGEEFESSYSVPALIKIVSNPPPPYYSNETER